MSLLRRHPIAAVCLAAIACGLACAFLPGPPFARVPFALPLLFVLPGFAVWAALFPDGREDAVRTVTFSVGLSVVVAIIGGVELGAFGAYSAGSWAALMVGLTLVAAFVAHRRRFSWPDRPPHPAGPRRIVPRVAAISAGLASLALIGAAIGLARTPLPVPADRGYTEFSVGPTESRGTTIPLRIVSSEARTRRFRLELIVPGRAPEAREVTIAPGEIVEEEVSIGDAGHGTVFASLVDEDGEGTPYRRLRIILPLQDPAPPSPDAVR